MKDIISSYSSYQEEEESNSSSKGPRRNSKLKKELGGSIYPIFILSILIFLGLVAYVVFGSHNINFISKIFMNQTLFFSFIGCTVLLLIFGIIHISYIYASKKFRNTDDDKRVLTHTFSGYILISVSYLFIFSSLIGYYLIFKTEIEDYILTGAYILYFIMGIVSLILLSIGLAKINKDDKKDKLYAPSAIATTLVALNTIIGGLAPALLSMYKQQNKSNKSIELQSKLLSKAASNSGSIIFNPRIRI